MKKSVKVILVSVLLLIGIISFQLIASAEDYPFDNLFGKGFAGYTSDEGEVLTTDYISSKHIEVTAGDTVWFGPCDTTQYFQMVGFDANEKAVTDKIRGKELEVSDTFNNDMVIYKYIVPEGVAKLCFSAPGSVADVYTVAKTEISCLNWDAYWTLKGVSTEDYVGESSFYKVAKGEKIYFGVITEEDALATITYDDSANKIGAINASDLRLVESFGGAYGIYCYTINDSNVRYVQVPYDTRYEQYYTYMQKAAADATSDKDIVDAFIAEYGIQRPLSSTVEALSGKSALFVGDSITYGARDRAKIYEYGGWAGRIGYYCNMDVLNNGVSGACITTARLQSSGEGHYIYNNLVAAKDNKYDYVIMHGLFNDASSSEEVGTAKGPSNFDPNSANVTQFADALELLFYTAKTQHPEATLGFIVNFETDRAVNQEPYVDMAIQICKAWGIEYLDLYHNKTFSVEFDDGLHPTSAGYDSMYTIVANWMAKLGKSGSADTTLTTADVMSYNVYYNTDDSATGVNNRLQKVAAKITECNPDILLLQEVSGGNSGWTKAIIQFANDDYGYYGYAHGAEKGIDSSAATKDTTNGSNELTPILWKTNKYSLVKSGHFQVPSEWTLGGETYDSKYPRCVNWVILKDKSTSEELLVVNYHAVPDREYEDGTTLDNTLIRSLTAQFVVDEISKLQAANGYPATILGGDLNMAIGSTAYTTITGNGFQNICKSADESDNCGSYNAWTRTDRTKYAVGDYLFMDEGTTASTYRVIDDFDPDNQNRHISDHSPIMAQIQY